MEYTVTAPAALCMARTFATHASPLLPRWPLALSLSIASITLGGCIGAPGMRMQLPPTIAAGAVNERTAAAGDRLRIPLRDIDARLVETARVGSRSAAADAARLLTEADYGYRVGVGDVLQIVVWDHPEFVQAAGNPSSSLVRAADPPAGFVVDADGTLHFPYAGTMPVAGLRVHDIRERLVARLARTFRDPQVTVRVASFRSKRVYVEGEIREPGSYALNDTRTTLHDAIGSAGGFTSQADQSRVIVVRGGVEARLDLSGATRSGLDPAHIVLRDGDRLRVASRDDNGVFVMGEVHKPGRAVPSRNGRLTLSDALAQAGSINPATADAAQLYVIRGSSGSTPEVFRLDATSPVAMVLANQFELEPQDIVYIDGSGLVRLNRLLSLLMPAINTGLTAAIATQ
ncbi:polysaccharide biosynthesis/export family protein [Burkholderia stagnalis]|uniref:polysaccharide biosynthesis/export family protein n=1 Tax=Burkholderia stagnalis TaxID=1503054 RepID=UPI000AEB5D85